MKFRWISVAALTVLMAASSLSAQGSKWFEASSENFILFTDTNQEKARRLLADLELRIAAFSQALGDAPRRQFPIEVFLFKQEQDFIEALPRLERGADPRTAFEKSAYVVKGPDRVFIVARDKSPEDIADDAGHALGHVLFERKAIWRPFWLAEGAAEYVRKAGRDPDTKKISEEDGFSVKDLLTIVPSATYSDNDEGGAFRRQSYGLLRLILDENPQSVRNYLARLGAEDGSTARMDIQSDAFEDRLKSYVETRLAAPSVLGAVEVREADLSKVAIHRGDVLLATGRTSNATESYGADSKEASAARAILARFVRSTTESARILDRASREMPDIGLVQFHFGALELQNERDIAAQIAALERATQLLPLFGRAHAELGRLYSSTGRPEQALTLLDKALTLEPESADRIYELRAGALLALGKHDEALRTMNLAVSLPHADRVAAERYSAGLLAFKRKIENARRDADYRRLEQLRNEVVAEVRTREPRPQPAPPPPPVPDGRITYEIEARVTIQVIETVYPEYPEALRKSGTGGAITLRVDVDADGRVKTAAVTSSAVPALNAATVDAVKRWSFSPAPRAGATRTLRIVINFLL
jgi:TonB family protein